MIPNVRELELTFHAILSELGESLPAYQVQDMRELCDAGELGVGFENFCTQLYEFDVAVSERQQLELRSIGSAMRIDPEYWERLSVKSP